MAILVGIFGSASSLLASRHTGRFRFGPFHLTGMRASGHPISPSASRRGLNWAGVDRNGRGKVRRVIAGAQADLQGGNQMAGVMAHHGQFGPTAMAFHAALALQEMATDVVAFQTGGVDARFRLVVDQAARLSRCENRRQQLVKSPFLGAVFRRSRGSSSAESSWTIVS